MRWSGSAPPGPALIPTGSPPLPPPPTPPPPPTRAGVPSTRLYIVSRSSEPAPFLEAILFRHLGRKAAVLDVHRQPLLALYLLDAGHGLLVFPHLHDGVAAGKRSPRIEGAELGGEAAQPLVVARGEPLHRHLRRQHERD